MLKHATKMEFKWPNYVSSGVTKKKKKNITETFCHANIEWQKKMLPFVTKGICMECLERKKVISIMTVKGMVGMAVMAFKLIRFSFFSSNSN